MIKYGMMAVGLLMMSGILWPVLSGVLGDKPNEATRLVEATERTNNKAESLNDSFTRVIPPAPADPTYAPNPAGQHGNGAIPVSSNGEPAKNGEQEPGEPQPSPTPDRYAHASEHAVRDAMEYLNRLQTEMQPSQTEYIQAVEQLQRAWNPRYLQAYDEFKRFARKIDHADTMAQEYFLVQQKPDQPDRQLQGPAAGRANRRHGASGVPGLEGPGVPNAGAGKADNAGPTRHEPDHRQAEPLGPLRGVVRGLSDHTPGDHDATRRAGPLPGGIGQDTAVPSEQRRSTRAGEEERNPGKAKNRVRGAKPCRSNRETQANRRKE